MKLYYHKTSDGDKEGVFEGSNYIVRIDGDIEKDAELTVHSTPRQLLKQRDDLREAGKELLKAFDIPLITKHNDPGLVRLKAIQQAEQALSKAGGA